MNKQVFGCATVSYRNPAVGFDDEFVHYVGDDYDRAYGAYISYNIKNDKDVVVELRKIYLLENGEEEGYDVVMARRGGR